MLCLEFLHHFRIFENVLAVVEEHHVAIVGEAIDLAADGHLIVAIGGRDILQFIAVAELVDQRIEVFQRPGPHQIRHPGGDDVQRIISAGTGAEVLHDLGEHLVGRHFDDLDLDSGEFFPLRS